MTRPSIDRFDRRRQQSGVRRRVPARFLLRGIAAAILAVAGMANVALAQSDSAPAENKPMKPFRVIGNIYWVGLTDHGAFLITTPQGHILLDTTIATTVPNVRDSIEQLGFNLKDIKYIVGLHAHADHMGGVAMFKELTGAQFAVMEQDAGVMSDGGRSDFREDGKEQFKPVKADRLLQDGDKITLGDVTMVAHLTAGHTRGCTTWTTTVEDAGKKLNVVFVCGVDVSGDRSPLVANAKYPTVAEDFERSFRVLKSLPVDVFLYTRAPNIKLETKRQRLEKGEKPNPFIDPDGFKEYVAAREKLYRDQLAHDRAAAAH
jgi:metallo-beta-lactamase class B